MNEIIKKSTIVPWQGCPYCGGVGEPHSYESSEGVVWHYIRCRNCGALCGPRRYLSDAIMWWDSRKKEEQKEGVWQLEGVDGERYNIACSVCGEQYEYIEGQILSKYCGECGARLVQQKPMGSKKISAEDQMLIARRIYLKKKAEVRKEELKTLKMKEKAEEVLQKQIDSDEEKEKQN